MSQPPRSVPACLATALALLLLLGLSVLLWELDLGVWSTAGGMAIAAAKALLVALVFMHLDRASGIVRLAAAAGLLWFALLMALTLADFLTRQQP